MSEVKRFPDDSHAWWWRRGLWAPIRVRQYYGRIQHYDSQTGSWHDLSAGEYLPCPAPEWPPEPPPRPRMVWASVDDDSPWWWVLVDYDETPWLACRTTCGGMWAAGNELIPHDHPEQSAEESRRILEAEKNS